MLLNTYHPNVGGVVASTVILVRLVQFRKAPSPIVVTFEGIVTFVKPEQV